MNELLKISLIFHWFDHCLNTFTYQVVKNNQIKEKIISAQSHSKTLGKICNVFFKKKIEIHSMQRATATTRKQLQQKETQKD